ncbi:MAG: hypothetical protein P4M14_02540 [Gammaproteobacteria bacterium]|nr:hypothetical protein [Gammaproteobacteria bacterium]
MTPFKKSLILLACLSAYFSPTAFAVTVSNNASSAQVEKQGPAAAPAATPADTQPMSPADAANPNLSPTGGEAPTVTSPAMNEPSVVSPSHAATPAKGNVQGGAPQGLIEPSPEGKGTPVSPQGMPGASQGMPTAPPGVQGGPQGMQAPPQGMQGAPQGMQAPPQGVPNQ